ncbi:MAG: BrnA antitoxin family protein [Nostoc sp.]|uniref:BrnA antitoxin family protein n=1 Tax=Nostoc sp. TaxID=1180 RepID=UPI002FF6B84F
MRWRRLPQAQNYCAYVIAQPNLRKNQVISNTERIGILCRIEDFFQKATIRVPAPQAQQLVQIEPDILEWFQAQSGEYKTLINSVLRRYIKNCDEHRAV